MVATEPALELKLFGRPGALWRRTPLRFPTQKSLALVCYVAIRGRTVPRRELAELLWQRNQNKLLRLELYRLRKSEGAASWLDDSDGVRVRAVTDLADFQAALRVGDHRAALGHYLGSDDELLLKGLHPRRAPAFNDWLDSERTRLDQLLQNALRSRGEELARLGHPHEATTHLEKSLSLDPLDEAAYRGLIRIELERGDLQAARRHFEQCRRALAEDLGMTPTSATLEAAAEIERAISLPARMTSTRRIPPALLRPPMLAGREHAWAKLEHAWHLHQPVFVAGPAGIGKSRLVMDFVQAKTGGDYAVLHGRPGDRKLPYSTIARGFRIVHAAHPEFIDDAETWIRREMAHLVPDVIDEAPSTIRTRADKARFSRAFELLLHLMARYFGAYVADDMQFFDTASFLETGRTVLEIFAAPDGVSGRSMNAFRTDEMPAEFVDGVKRMATAGSVLYIELQPLEETAVRQFVTGLELDLPSSLVDALPRHIGGNPLYILETLRNLHETGRISDPELTLHATAVPERIDLIVSRRLDWLSIQARRIAEILAALQNDATYDLLAELSGLDPPARSTALAELERAQFTRGLGFAHDVLCEIVNAKMPESVAMALHEDIAQALESRGAPAARIAYHWTRSGDPGRALPWWLLAAESALAQGLVAQAVEWLERVIHAGAPDEKLHAEARRLLDTTPDWH
jgi:DNA-binding SARP family transcriptional activator